MSTFGKIYNKINQKGKINVNHIVLNRNIPNKKIFDLKKNNENSLPKNIFKKKKLSPYKPEFNKLLSNSILTKAKDANQKPTKLLLKSPLNLLKGIPQPNINNIDVINNIPFLPINLNKINKNISLNNLPNIEYNSINCIINNFNLSCKNVDINENNKKKEEDSIKFKNYDYFIKNNKIKNRMNNLKKNNITNLSNLNISNTNNITINDIKKEEIIIENKQKKEKIKQKEKENKERLVYLKELEKKNTNLQKEYDEIKTKHMEYSKSLERLMKFLRVLKNNGMEVSEMMDNISSGEDYDEYVDDDQEESENTEEEKNETILSDGSVLSNLKQLSSGLLRSNEEYSKGSKLILKSKNIPLLKFSKIKKINNK